MAGTVEIKVNDRPQTFAAPVKVEQVVASLGLAGRRGIAIAVGETVVPRSRWAVHELRTGDAVVVIQATQGG